MKDLLLLLLLFSLTDISAHRHYLVEFRLEVWMQIDDYMF